MPAAPAMPPVAGAPIGGVLFSLEEACSVWSRRIAWRCFLCASLAVVAHATLNPHAANGMLSSSLRRLTPAEWLQQLPAIVAVSVGGGLLGALFNRVRLALRPWRPRPKHHTLRLRRTAGMAVLTVTVIAVLAARVGRCLPVPQLWADTDERMWVQHACPEGQYNDLATAWLASPGVCAKGRSRRGWRGSTSCAVFCEAEGCLWCTPECFSPPASDLPARLPACPAAFGQAEPAVHTPLCPPAPQCGASAR